jgi:hypothetical protein
MLLPTRVVYTTLMLRGGAESSLWRSGLLAQSAARAGGQIRVRAAALDSLAGLGAWWLPGEGAAPLALEIEIAS